MRTAITPHEQLSATLRYLASGSSYQSLRFPIAISARALRNIIPETREAIIKVLKDYKKVSIQTNILFKPFIEYITTIDQFCYNTLQENMNLRYWLLAFGC